MRIIQKAQAGSFESSDILILAEPNSEGEGRKIELESGVYKQYAQQILDLIHEQLDLFKINNIHLKINDKGAIQPVIRARMQTVLLRALGKQEGTLYK